MKYTTKLQLKKPDSTDYVNIADLNENMDILDVAVGELKDGTTVISELQTVSKTLAGAINELNEREVDLTPIETQVDEIQSDLTTHTADDTSHVKYGVATGANPKVVTLNPAPTALIEGMALSFKNVTQNTGAVTLNVNGLGAKQVLKSNGTALANGNLKANSIYTVRYNGTSFILQGEGGEYGTAGADQVLTGFTVGTENGIINGTAPNIKAQPGLVVFATSPSEVVTTETSYTKVKEVTLNLGTGTVRVFYTLKTNGGDSRTQIYVNGVARGPIRSHFSSALISFTEDITVNNGDSIQLYTHAIGTGRNVQIYAFEIRILNNPFAIVNL